MALLDNWHEAANTHRGPLRICCFGDSTTEGTVNVTNGGWTESLRNLMATRFGRASHGLHAINRNGTDTGNAYGWTLSGGSYTSHSTADWTIGTYSDAWACGPWCGTAGGDPAANVFKATGGTTQIATWTKPTSMTCESFWLYVVDGPSSGNFAVSINGGPWATVSAAWAHDNSVKRFYIEPDTIIFDLPGVTTNVRVRAADAAGTTAALYILGIEPLPARGSGLAIDDLGANSDWILNVSGDTRAAGTANWHAYMDVVQPKLITVMGTNDSAFWTSGATFWKSQLQRMVDYASSINAGIVLMSFFEQVGRETALAGMRADTDAIAQLNNVPHLNLYALVGDHAATVTAGYMDNVDGLHETNAGADFIAQQLWKIIGRPGYGAMLRN